MDSQLEIKQVPIDSIHPDPANVRTHDERNLQEIRGSAPRAPALTQERLRELLAYDRETGDFRWRISKGAAGRGSSPRGVNPDGYKRLMIDGRRYYQHSLAWLWIYGYLPARIDHINGDRADNRLCNLRECTRSENRANCRMYKNNRSGFKGVYRRNNRWCAEVKWKRRKHHLGSYSTPEEAYAKYCEGAALLHGEFHRGS